MLRRIPRFLRRAVLLAVVLAVSVSVYQSWTAGSPGAGGWTQSEFGPLGPADRDLLVKVRLAGLWEGPTGQQAQQQATSPQVRDVGGKLAAEHAQLDAEVRRVADQLGVPLPSSPNAQQVGWMSEISATTGSQYDRTFVQRVREAHGIVLPIIAEVRTGTRNDLMREFANTADAFVSRHCEYLESTGLVDFGALPQPSSPGLLAGATGPQDLIVPILVFVAAILAAIALFAAFRNRDAQRAQRVTVPPRGPASAPLPALATMAAIPAPRPEPDLAGLRSGPVHDMEPGLGGVSGTGPHGRVTGTGPHPVHDTGSHRTDPGLRPVGDTGPHRRVTDTGSHRTDPGLRPVTDTGPHQAVTDTGSHRLVSDTGPHRRLTDTGPHRRVTDTGSHRLVTDTGSHRLPPRSKPRHSVRR